MRRTRRRHEEADQWRYDKGPPVWSPDSKALLYTASDKKLLQVHARWQQDDVIAERRRRRASAAWRSRRPQWSPDGKWVSFTKLGSRRCCRTSSSSRPTAAKRGASRAPTPTAIRTPIGRPTARSIVYLSGSDVGNIGAAGRQHRAALRAVARRGGQGPQRSGRRQRSAAAESERHDAAWSARRRSRRRWCGRRQARREDRFRPHAPPGPATDPQRRHRARPSSRPR